ncbi:carboxylesterase family protein [Streptomyces lydicus]|uniref:carboxylesterase family protein n=1 Tax=Streptomyces lydicus TaxID=47763 RepID=UPI0036E9ACDF
MAAEESRPLIRRALLQSPPIGVDPTPPAVATAMARDYLDAADLCVGELRSATWQQLAAALNAMNARHHEAGFPVIPMGPVLGGAEVAEVPLAVTARSACRAISVLAGTTRDEQNFYFFPDCDEETAHASLFPWFGASSAEVYAHYACRRPGSRPRQIADDATGHALFERGVTTLAEHQASAGNPGYLYRFDWQSPGLGGELGAPHCVEPPFLFGNFDLWSGAELLRGADPVRVRALTSSFQQAVVRFVATGSPNGEGLPARQPYTPDLRATMRFDTVVECVGTLRSPGAKQP